MSLLRFLGWSVLTGLCAGLLAASALYLYLSPRLPDVEQLRDVKLQTPLRIYSRDDQLIAEYGEKRRTPVQIEDVPRHVVEAFLAAEDARFYEHFGIDPIGLARAAVQLISTGSIQSGGSTITMQVAKNFFLSQARTFTRKFNEIFLALKIEQELTKPEILELYLNKIYLGNRSYGIEAAANVYYGKSVTDLSIAEAAMIAGLPKAPSRYNPIINPKRAKIRRDWILGRMKDLGYISEAQWADATQTPVTARYHGTQPDLAAPYVAEMARQQLRQVLGDDLYTAGYKAWITVDSRLQRAARKAVRQGLLAYSRRHGWLGAAGRLPEGQPLDDDTLQTLLRNYPPLGGLEPVVITSMDDQQAQGINRQRKSMILPFEQMKWAWPRIDVDNQGPAPKSLPTS
ncbi:transglycosylase domain-containing protein [Hahella sp. SMD15-11]|uniref:peptidoglycan glycosyltransferase n=1 Tax=Thermohahella caldifontis TaxID=3142973 RepID=A0AB39V0Z0_9GAMM